LESVVKWKYRVVKPGEKHHTIDGYISYVEKQVTHQAQILADLFEENLNSELKNLEIIADYIENERYTMHKTEIDF